MSKKAEALEKLKGLPAGCIIQEWGMGLTAKLTRTWTSIETGLRIEQCPSHTAVYIGAGDNFVIEADTPKIKKTPLSKKFKNKSRIQAIVFKNLTALEVEKIKEVAYSKLGQYYDLTGYLHFFLRLFTKKVKPSPKRVFCSELAALCYKAIGIKISDKEDAYSDNQDGGQEFEAYTSPADIEKWALENKDKYNIEFREIWQGEDYRAQF